MFGPGTDRMLFNLFCRASPKADNMFEWTGHIDGPPDSVYAGGKFLIDIKIPTDYPFSPPKVVS